MSIHSFLFIKSGSARLTRIPPRLGFITQTSRRVQSPASINRTDLRRFTHPARWHQKGEFQFHFLFISTHQFFVIYWKIKITFFVSCWLRWPVLGWELRCLHECSLENRIIQVGVVPSFDLYGVVYYKCVFRTIGSLMCSVCRGDCVCVQWLVILMIELRLICTSNLC